MRVQVSLIVTATLAAVLASNTIEGATPADCDLHLSVKLTPDVPDPRDSGFLSSLVNSPAYQLTWVQGNDTEVLLELTGPGPDYQCKNEIERIRKDARVQEVNVVQSGTST